MRVDFFVDPSCPWSWLTSRWLAEVAPQRGLKLQWRSYSLLLRSGTEGLQDWQAAYRRGAHRAVRVMEALHSDNPDGVGRFYQTLMPQAIAAHYAGRPPYQDLEGTLVATGLAPSHALAADDAAWDAVIRRSMAEAFALAGGVIGTPVIVLHREPPVAFMGPVVAPAPTGVDALALWDAFVALAAVPGVFELSRPRPDDIPGLQ